jgi:hypothetical protein
MQGHKPTRREALLLARICFIGAAVVFIFWLSSCYFSK